MWGTGNVRDECKDHIWTQTQTQRRDTYTCQRNMNFGGGKVGNTDLKDDDVALEPRGILVNGTQGKPKLAVVAVTVGWESKQTADVHSTHRIGTESKMVR